METIERALTFTDKSELAEYVRGNTFNKALYKAYLDNKDNSYNWKHSPIVTFNELYYQCTRVYNDPNPESEVYSNYLEDVRNTLGTRYASDMIFAMVNAVIEVMDFKPENVEFFQMELQAHYKQDGLYFPQYMEFAEKFIAEYGKQNLKFPFCPVPPSYLRYDYTEWKRITNGFDEYMIRKYVERYSKTEDRLALIDKIECAYDEDEEEIQRLEMIKNLPF